MKEIAQIRKLSLWIFFIPFIAINLCLLISQNPEFLENTIFKVDYIEDTSNFQSETFNFIVVLLDENSKIISKEKFNRSFLSKSKSEIIKNKEGLINIVVKNSQDQIYNYQLLLGLIKDEKN